MSSKGSSFWRVTVTVPATGRVDSFVVRGPTSFDEERVESILREVHPEYDKLDVISIEKPEWAREWSY